MLFVGTKRQAQDAIAEEAQRSGMFFVNQRWLGGLLTNFTTIQRSLARLRDLEAMETDGRYETLSKKEIAQLEKEKRKLQKNLEGIRHMSRLPDALFVVDTRKEKIAVDEARKLKIPVIGVVDTNCDPDEVDFVIPGNDDALRAIRLFASKIADAVIAGRGLGEASRGDEARRRRRRPRPTLASEPPGHASGTGHDPGVGLSRCEFQDDAGHASGPAFLCTASVCSPRAPDDSDSRRAHDFGSWGSPDPGAGQETVRWRLPPQWSRSSAMQPARA